MLLSLTMSTGSNMNIKKEKKWCMEKRNSGGIGLKEYFYRVRNTHIMIAGLNNSGGFVEHFRIALAHLENTTRSIIVTV